MIMSCLGSAVMQNVDESIATGGASSRAFSMSHPPSRGKHQTAVRSDQVQTTESTDEDSERIRRDSTSVKSTLAFQFWSNYVGECGTNADDKRESASPHSVDPGSNVPGSKGATQPPSSKLSAILNRSVDLACFSVNPSLTEDNHDNGTGKEASASATPRVSCSIEVTGRRSLSRTYKVNPTFHCAPRQGAFGRTVPSQDTLGSTGIDMRDDEGLATDPSQDTEREYGLTPDPTLSVVSSGYEDGLTPDPTVSIQSSYVPASYFNVETSKSEKASSRELINSTESRLRKGTSEGTLPASSLRCHPDESPTFTHYSLLIGKGSADSDDLFAALSASTKSGVSVRDLQLPVSSLSATTFLSSPSASTVEGSEALAIDAAASSTAVEAPIPTSTKSTFSTVISSMSSFSIDEPKSTLSKSGAFRRCSREPVSLRVSESKLIQKESSTATTADTVTTSEPSPVTENGSSWVSTKGVPVRTNDRSWIRKETEVTTPQVETEAKKKWSLGNSLDSKGSRGDTEVTAQETQLSSQTMDDSLPTVSEATEPSKDEAMLDSGVHCDKKTHDDQRTDPYEWAYEVWRAKGLISGQKTFAKDTSRSSRPISHPHTRGGDSSAQRKRATTRQQEDTSESTAHVQVLLISRSASSKGNERAKVGNFSSILQHWREKSDEQPLAEHPGGAVPVTSAYESSNAEDPVNQSNDDELREVWESFESSGTAEKTSHTRDVWSPFVPRPPSPKSKRLSASPGLRRTPSPRPSPGPSNTVAQTGSPFNPQQSSERPPVPLLGSGKKPANVIIKDAVLAYPRPVSEVNKVGLHSSPPVAKSSPSPSRRPFAEYVPQDDIIGPPTSQASKITNGKDIEWGILAPITQQPRRSVTLPKSHSDYKTAAQTFLRAVESNNHDQLKAYANQSDDGKIIKVTESRSHGYISSAEEPMKPWLRDRRKPWHASRGGSFEARSSSEDSPDDAKTTPRLEGEQQKRNSNIQAITFTSSRRTSMLDEAMIETPCHENIIHRVEKSPPQEQLPGGKPELPLKRESPIRSIEHPAVTCFRRAGSKCSPASTFRSPTSRGKEMTRLSPGETLIGKTIKVPSSIKRKPEPGLNDTAESGTWVRLLSLESAGADDSAEYEGTGQIHFNGTGSTEESHPWRRDMVVRKVNSFEGDFSVRTSLFEESCLCASSAFSGKDELVEFYLPKMGMACTCGARRSDTQLRNPEEPTSLENILRPWQAEFLASFGIYRGDQLVKAHHRSGPALAKAMRRYRKKHGMTSFQTKCCGMALGIWTKTSKAFVRSIRKQITTGVDTDGIKVPNTLYILTSFLDKIPTGAGPYIEGFGSIPSSIQSDECSL